MKREIRIFGTGAREYDPYVMRLFIYAGVSIKPDL